MALFGRMLADMPEKEQNAACRVAAISTTPWAGVRLHRCGRPQTRDTAGADMMGTVEFNSACFYRYAVLDWEKLVENLQDDKELANKGLRAFLEGFVVAEPTGKQNTFAAHNPPEFVAVSVRRHSAPRSLANAFETAIRAKKDESLTKASATRLVEKAKVLQGVYGGEGETLILNPIHADVAGLGTAVESLKIPIDKTVAAVKVSPWRPFFCGLPSTNMMLSTR